MIDMSKTDSEVSTEHQEVEVKALFSAKGVKVRDEKDIGALTSRGFGTAEKKILLLAPYEVLYLVGRGLLEVKDSRRKRMDFEELLQRFERMNSSAWSQYLVYRDLRSRGYVAREGFGEGVDFRVYERGQYSKDAAKYLVISVQEGKPIGVSDLVGAVRQSQRSKKELVLAVMNRRGEIVYYSIGQLAMQ
jgi:tRNA-intron endonuclease